MSFVLFGLVALSLLVGLMLVYRTIEAERIHRAQVSRTTTIMLQLRNVSRAAVNAETGQRGYFITLDRRYLDPYHVGRAAYPPALANLRELLGHDPPPRQRQLLAEIERLSATRFAEIERNVRLIEEGRLVEVQHRILMGEGLDQMNRLRRAVGEMERIENDALSRSIAKTTAAEARVLPLLGILSILLTLSLALGSVQVARAARAREAQSQAAMLESARDRANLLAHELNHRVKNLFAVVLAIIRMSARDEPGAGPAIERIVQRINALLIAHDVTQGGHGHKSGDLATLVETTLAPYRSRRNRCAVSGPDIRLSSRQATPLGLVLHELATNAVKYGAWSCDGAVEVAWETKPGAPSALELAWKEHGVEGCDASGQEGFGSKLMRSAARQLDGSIERSFGADGVEVRIAFPLETGEQPLEMTA